MNGLRTTEVEPTLVRATINGYGESFWATPLPGETNVGTVANALHNGVISYGDVVEWNADGDIVALRARSDRVTIVVWIEADPEDLAIQAKWTQASKDAAAAWTARGLVVEGGLGMLAGAFVARTLGELKRMCDALLADLFDENWNLQVQVGPMPGFPTDPGLIGLSVPVTGNDWQDEPDPRDLPDLGDMLMDDVIERDLINRLKSLGFVHASLHEGEVVDCALRLLEVDYRCYKSCEEGRTAQVLVLAGRTLSLEKGLLVGELPGSVFDTDFLSE